jgi:hypothetical protein
MTIGGDQDLILILTLTGGQDGDPVDRHPVGPVDGDRTPTDLADPALTNSPGGARWSRVGTQRNEWTGMGSRRPWVGTGRTTATASAGTWMVT